MPPPQVVPVHYKTHYRIDTLQGFYRFGAPAAALTRCVIRFRRLSLAEKNAAEKVRAFISTGDS